MALITIKRVARSLTDVDHPRLIALISFTHGMNEFYSIVIPPLIPFIIPALDITYADASLLVFVFFMTYSVVQLPMGKLKDTYNSRILLSVGMVVLSLGIVTVAIAPSYLGMLLGMLLAGVGGSTYHPTGMAIISDVESDVTYGRSMGIHSAFGSFGSITAPLVLTAIAIPHGWRTALFVGGIIGIVYAVLLYLLFPLVGYDMQSHTKPFTDIARESMSKDIDLRSSFRRLWRYMQSRTIILLILLFFLAGAEVRAVQTFLPVFTVEVLGTDRVFGNTMLSIMMVAAGSTSILAGYAVDTIDRAWFTGGCFLFTALVTGLLVLVRIDQLFLPLVFAMLGVVMFSVYPAINSITASVSSLEKSGTLFAVTNTSVAVGQAVSPVILGAIADFYTLGVAFVTTTVIAIIGLLVVLCMADIVSSS